MTLDEFRKCMTPIDLQNEEFDAVAELSKEYRRIRLTPIVDDDYPEVRYAYERAIRSLIYALRENGRIS